MSSNRLQLNGTKVEILWCTSSHRRYQLPTNQLTIGNDQVTPVTSIHNLGIHMDWTPIYPREHMSSELLPAALLFFVTLELQSLVVALVLSLSHLNYDSTVLFWFATTAGRQDPVCSERHGTTDICCPSSRPHQPTTAESSLVACW